jgi:hypothetical protein
VLRISENTIITLFIFICLCGLGGGMYFLPKYSVYQAEMQGKAILAKALSSKQAQIADAEAKYESAKYLKKAAIEIQNSLTPQYLHYLEIQMQEVVGEHNPNAVYFFPKSEKPVIAVK